MTVRRTRQDPHARRRLVQELIRRVSVMSRRERDAVLRGWFPSLTLSERFEILHALGVYHHSDSSSGAGSTLSETAALREALPGIVARFGIRSLLDMPCGDFHWMRHVPLEGVDYMGIDIVPGIVHRNRRLYAAAERRFEVLDATVDVVPKVDLVMCRDLLIHLSLDAIEMVLRNIAASGSSWLLATHFAATANNAEIVSGDFRPINLCRAPFHLPEPLEIVVENSLMADGAFRDRAMALWPVSALQDC